MQQTCVFYVQLLVETRVKVVGDYIEFRVGGGEWEDIAGKRSDIGVDDA